MLQRHQAMPRKFNFSMLAMQEICNFYCSLVLLVVLHLGHVDCSVTSSAVVAGSQNISTSSNNQSSEVCNQRVPIGIANGLVNSAQLSSSSVYNSYDARNPPRFWGASQARLRTASCWCGGNQTWKEDWIQIDLGTRIPLNGIAIQGDPQHPPNDIREFYGQISDDGVIFKNQTKAVDKYGNNVVNVAPSRDSDKIRYVWSPVSITTRYVRLRTSKLLLVGHNAKFCLRFELFGCPPVGQEVLYPVGLQNEIIPDSQFSASSSHVGEPPSHARLNMRNAWCTSFAANQWLQFDLGRVLAVQAITTQGRYGRTSNDMVSSYHISYANFTAEKYHFFNENGQRKIFTGNNGTGQDPVMNSFTPTIIARYIRIHPLTGGPSGIGGPAPIEFCIRAELYAKHADCAADISSLPGTKFYSVLSGTSETLTQSLDIYSTQAWCADMTSQLKILRIDLGDLRPVSGIVISGNPNAENWLTGFNLKLGLENTNMKAEGSYKGTIGRTEIAVNWLKNTRIARFVEIEATTFVGHKCFRVRVLGCPKVQVRGTAPVATTIKLGANFVEINIKVFSAANSTNTTSNNTIVVKYMCVNGSNAKPCNDTSQKLLIFKLTNNTNANITGLEPGTNYRVTTQVLYDQSLSEESVISEESVMMITTNVQKTVGEITSSAIKTDIRPTPTLLIQTLPTRSSTAKTTAVLHETISSSSPLRHASSSLKSLSESYTPIDKTPLASTSRVMSSGLKFSSRKEISPITEKRMASSTILHTTSYERNIIESAQILVKSKVVSDDAIVGMASTKKTAQSVSSSSMGSLTRSSFGSETTMRLSVFPSVLSSSKRSGIETIATSKLQLTKQVISASNSSGIRSSIASPSSEFSTGSRDVASIVLSVSQSLSATRSIETQFTKSAVSPSSDVFSSNPKTNTLESSHGLMPTQKDIVSESLITIASEWTAQSTSDVLVSKPITYSSVQARKSTAEITARPAPNTTPTSLLQDIPTSIETKLPSSTHDRSTASFVVAGSTFEQSITVLSSTALHGKSSVPESVEISPKPSTSIASFGSIYSSNMNATTRGLNTTAKGLSSLNAKPSTGSSTDGYSLPFTDVVTASVSKDVGLTSESSPALESSSNLGAYKSTVSMASLWSIISATSNADSLSSPTTLINSSVHASNAFLPSSLASPSQATLQFPLSSTALGSPRYDVLTGSAHSYSQTLGPSATIINQSSSLAIASTRSNTVSTEPLRIQPSFSTKLVSNSIFTPTKSLGSKSTVLNIPAESSQGNVSSTLVEPLLTFALNQTQQAVLLSSFESTATMAPKTLSSVASSRKSVLARSQTPNTDMVATASHSPGSRSDALASSLIEETSHASHGSSATFYYTPCWITYYMSANVSKIVDSTQHVTATTSIMQSFGSAVSITESKSSVVIPAESSDAVKVSINKTILSRFGANSLPQTVRPPSAQSSASYVTPNLSNFPLSSTNEMSSAGVSSNIVDTAVFSMQTPSSTGELTPKLTNVKLSTMIVTSSPVSVEPTTTSIPFVPPLFVINRKRRAVQEGSILISPSFVEATSVFNTYSTTANTPDLITDTVAKNPSATMKMSLFDPSIQNEARILTSSLGLCLVYETVKQLSQVTSVSPVYVTQRTSAMRSDLKTSSRVVDVSRYSDMRISYKDSVTFSSGASASGLQHSETMVLDSSLETGISRVSSSVDSKKSVISNTVSPIPSYTRSITRLPEGPTTFVSVTPPISINTSYTAPSDIVAISQSIQGFSLSIQGFSSPGLASSLSVAQIISSNIHRASDTSVVMTYLPPFLNATSTEQQTTLAGPSFTAALTETTFSLSSQKRLTSITSTESSQGMPLIFATSLRDSVSLSIGISNFQHSTSSVSAAFVSLLSGFKTSTSMAYSLKALDISDVMTMTTKSVASAALLSTAIQSSLLLPAADISVNNETRSISVSQFTTGKSFEFKPASTLDSMSSRVSTVRLLGVSASEPTVSSRDSSVSFVDFSPNTISLQIEPTVSSMTSSYFATVNSPNTQTISTMSLASINASKSNSPRISQTSVTSLLPSFDSSVLRSFAVPAPINRSSLVDLSNTSAASPMKSSSAPSKPSSSSSSEVSDIGLTLSPKFSASRQESVSSAVTPTLKLSSIQIHSFVSIKEFSSNATALQTAVSTSQLTNILSTNVEQPRVTHTLDHSSLEGISATSVLAISLSSSLVTGQSTLGKDSVVLSTGVSPPSMSLVVLSVSSRTEIGANNTALTTLAASSSVATVAFPQGSDPLKSTIKASEVAESSYHSQATTTRLSVDVSLSSKSDGTGISNTVQSTPASTAYPVSSAYESVSRGHLASTPVFTSLLVRPYKSTSSFSTTSRFDYTKLPVSNQSPIDSARESSIYIATVPSTVSSQFQSISKLASRTVYSSSSSATNTYTVEAKPSVSIPAISSTAYPFQVQESSSLTLGQYGTTKRASSSSISLGKPRLTTHEHAISASSIFKGVLPSVTSIRIIATSPGFGLKSSSIAPASYGAKTKEVTSSAVGQTSTFTSTTPKSFRPSKIPSSAIIITQRSSSTTQPSSSKVLITPTPPSVYGLAYVPLQVPVTKDVLSQAYKTSLESKIIATYYLLKYKRKRRAVTLAGNTATITILVRRGITEYVDVVFFVMENNVVIAAQITVDTLNQMTLEALTQRFADTVLGPVVVYGSTTIAPTTIVPPTNQQLLGMVLTDSPNNNFTTPNNVALFQTKMADYYRSDGTSTFRVYYHVQEPKNIVYVEMYVRVNSATQAASVVESFFKSKSKASLSAVIPWTITAMPYALSHIKSTDANHVKMNVRLVLSNTDVTSLSFKNLMSVKITELYREAKDGLIGWTKRGSVTTYIVSSTSPSTGQAKIIFFILDKGQVVSATSLVGIFAKLTMSRMSTVLGAEVLSLPALLTALVPTAPPASTSYLWTIGVGVAAFLLILLIIVCLYYRWRHGGYTVKQDLQKVDLPKKSDLEMKERALINNEYRYPAHYISGTSHGWPDRRSVNFAAPPEEKLREREYQDGVRSKRKKIGSRKSTSSNGTRNRGYDGSVESLTSVTDTSHSDASSDGYLISTPMVSPVPQRPSTVSKSKSTHATQTKDPLEETAYVQMQSTPVKSKPASETHRAEVSEQENLYESIKQYARTPLAAQLPPERSLNYRELLPVEEKVELENAAGRAANRRLQKNDIYFSRSALGRLLSIPKGRTSLSSPELTEIDHALKTKAELERSKNKIRQREKTLMVQNGAEDKEIMEEHENDWTRMQKEISTILDPVATYSISSGHRKANRRRRRFSRGHQIEITDNSTQDSMTKPAVKVNNYIEDESPSTSTSADTTPRSSDLAQTDSSMLEARKRVHSLVDDAFIALTSNSKSQKIEEQEPGTRDLIYEEPMTMKETKIDQSEQKVDVSHEDVHLQQPLPHDGMTSYYDMLLQRPIASQPPWQNSIDNPIGRSSSTLRRSRPGSTRREYLSYLSPNGTSQLPSPQLYKISPAPIPYFIAPQPQQAVYLTPVPNSFENSLYTSMEEQDQLPTDETTQESSPDQTQTSSSKQELLKLSDITYDYRDNPLSLVQYIKQELLRLAHNRGQKTRVTAFEKT